MAYSNIESKNKSSFFIRLKNKLSKILIKNFPLNYVRILGVKMCGYKVGKKVYIGEEFLIVNTVSENSTSLEIQDLVSVAPRVTVVLSSDPNWSHLSKIYNPIKGKIILEKGCWIGTGAIILPNITIGENAIVAAGAVVTKNVASFTVVAGIPAKQIDTINF